MPNVLKRLEHQHVKPWLRALRPWRQQTFAGIRVHYQKQLDGGGSGFGQEFIAFLRGRGMPAQPRAFEWCAGPGFIGFSLLGNGLCRTLCLADVNQLAVEACRRTIRHNGLADRVAVHHSDNLQAISPSERWDLVVSNPPHFIADFVGELRAHDEDWHIHRGFFASIGSFLKPDGVIVLQENNRGSTAETFRSMIEAAGFFITFVHGCSPRRTPDDRFYFMGIGRRGDRLPSWATGTPG